MNSISNDDSSLQIDFKAATDSAYEFLIGVKDKMGNEFSDVRLEEVQLSRDRSQWLITLGYNLSVPREEVGHDPRIADLRAFTAIRPQTVKREYKIFEVNAKTGEVESMKIRNV
jgi:hypothetical protein